MSARLTIDKTLKLYVGGKFIRSESGRTMPIEDEDHRAVNVARGSRKDLREAIRIARAATGPWAGRTAYNRGQILYRLAEMLEGRLPSLSPGAEAAIDRVVHHAGWSDKIAAVLSALNPVSTTYVNYARMRPLGVVCAAPDPADGLLGLVEAAAANAVMGNATVLLIDARSATAAAELAEALATSDFPGGVINVLTGELAELLHHAADHDDVDGLYLAHGATASLQGELEAAGARVLRRMLVVPGAARPATPIQLQKLAEVQTVWVSAYEPQGGAPGY
ncbi:MAG TPA: aldehyde dehydrogenase family protein [Deltaproteobacteria bacterium]|nr:aldehyde dehydrogenase family protein [Deltaproteobacteria bacterium]